MDPSASSGKFFNHFIHPCIYYRQYTHVYNPLFGIIFLIRLTKTKTPWDTVLKSPLPYSIDLHKVIVKVSAAAVCSRQYCSIFFPDCPVHTRLTIQLASRTRPFWTRCCRRNPSVPLEEGKRCLWEYEDPVEDLHSQLLVKMPRSVEGCPSIILPVHCLKPGLAGCTLCLPICCERSYGRSNGKTQPRKTCLTF